MVEPELIYGVHDCVQVSKCRASHNYVIVPYRFLVLIPSGCGRRVQRRKLVTVSQGRVGGR